MGVSLKDGLEAAENGRLCGLWAQLFDYEHSPN